MLRFYCSWNDTAMFGRKHNLKLFYYLCDDTTFIAAIWVAFFSINSINLIDLINLINFYLID